MIRRINVILVEGNLGSIISIVPSGHDKEKRDPNLTLTETETAPCFLRIVYARVYVNPILPGLFLSF